MVAYKVEYGYKNSIELYDIFLSLYSMTVLKKSLTDKERVVLRYYLLYGYSKDTKKLILADLGIKNSNLNTVNYTLQKRKFLKPHPNNQRSKVLSDDILRLKDVLATTDSDKLFMIKF